MTEKYVPPLSFPECKVCVTGGAGYIGRHLVSRLLDLGAEVVVIDDGSTGYIHTIPKGAPVFREDISRRPEQIEAAVKGCRYVFHLAGVSNVGLAEEIPVCCLHTAVLGTHAVLKAATEAGVERVVLASSCAVYGSRSAGDLSREDDPVNPISVYGASKAAMEIVAKSAYHGSGLKSSILRLFNVYGCNVGPQHLANGAIAQWIKSIARNGEARVCGKGHQTRDWIHIDDVVREMMVWALCPDPTCTVVNVGTGIATEVNEVVRMIARELGVELKPLRAPERKGDATHICADPTFIEGCGPEGMSRFATLNAGIAQAVQLYKATTK